MDSAQMEKDFEMYKEFFDQPKDNELLGVFELRPETHRENDYGVGYVYNKENVLHFKDKNDGSSVHPESPSRAETAFIDLCETGLIERMKQIPSREATEKELLLIHNQEHVDLLNRFEKMSEKEHREYEDKCDSVYVNKETGKCARLAAGSTIDLALSVESGAVKNGIALVRPPGHHAEVGCSKGFCIINNVALTVAALKENGVNRILVVDWDIHHGNGTQDVFYNDPDVLVISMHRYDNGTFYPSSEKADVFYVGGVNALGRNINIPWNERKKTDADYLHAFAKIVIPVATEFSPDMILVSAGFDGALNDPLGGCSITPNGFAAMTHHLLSVSPKIVLILEGGYNPEAVSDCLISCALILFGDVPDHSGKKKQVSKGTIETVNRVIYYHREFWTCFFSSSFEPPIVGKLAGCVSLESLVEHQLTSLLLDAGLLELPSSELVKARVFISKNASKNTVVMGHEKFCSSFKYNWKTVCPHGTRFSFPVVECVKRTIEAGLGVLLFIFPNQNWPILKRPRIKEIESSLISEMVTKFLKIACTEEKKILVFASGIGITALSKSLASRDFPGISIVSFFSQTLILPFIEKAWYLEKSINFIPSHLPRGAKITIPYGFGNCFSTGTFFMKPEEDELVLAYTKVIALFNQRLNSS